MNRRSRYFEDVRYPDLVGLLEELSVVIGVNTENFIIPVRRTWIDFVRKEIEANQSPDP